MRNIIRKGKNSLEDDVDAACNRMRNIVDTEWKRMTNFNSKIRPRLDAELSKLATRTLKRSVENLASTAKRAIDKCVSEFFTDTEDTLMRHLQEFDSRSFIKKVQSQINLEVDEKELFTVSNEQTEEEYGVMDFIGDFINGASFGVLGMAGRFLAYNDEKAEVLDHINTISNDFAPEPYLDAVMSRKDAIISIVKSVFIDGLIESLMSQIEEVKLYKDEKTSRLKSAEESLVSLNQRRKDQAQQMEDIERLKTELC